MVFVIMIIVLYVLPIWYNIVFIKKAHSPGGIHEGDSFEAWLFLATFAPVFNLVFAGMAFFSTPFDHKKTNWVKMKEYLTIKIYGIK